MFKSKSKWTSAVVALVMVLVFTTPIFAQGEVDPVVTPETVEESFDFLNHPIVKLIAEFFSDLFSPPVVEEPEPEVGGEDFTGEGPGFEEPSGDDGLPEGVLGPDPEPEPVIIPEEAVAAMHVDEDLGFGEIVKLMGIVEDAQATCLVSGENCEVTIESLLTEYEDGAGMGELFEKYGKPENLGVGHIRKELDPKGKEKTNNGKAKGKDK